MDCSCLPARICDPGSNHHQSQPQFNGRRRAAFTLTINGTGFNNSYGSPMVLWNQQTLSSTLSSNSQQITASVPASLIANPGTANIQVLIPIPSTSAAAYSRSNIVAFTITPSTP